MHAKSICLLAAVAITTLGSTHIKADAPVSYDDMLQAERQRMKDNYQNQGGDTVIKKQDDDTWLTNTPGTWGYLINNEKLRMKQSLPQTQVRPATSSSHRDGLNTMPATLIEGVQMQHEQMINEQKNKR